MILHIASTNAEMRDLNRLILQYLKQDGVVFGDEAEFEVEQYRHRFPAWLFLQDRGRCERMLWELRLMATDELEHDLDVVQESVLYYTAKDWIEIENDLMDGAGGSEDKARAARINQLELLLEELDTDFLLVPRLVNDVLADGNLYVEMGVDLHEYMDFLPKRLAARVERGLRDLEG